MMTIIFFCYRDLIKSFSIVSSFSELVSILLFLNRFISVFAEAVCVFSSEKKCIIPLSLHYRFHKHEKVDDESISKNMAVDSPDTPDIKFQNLP